MTNMTDFTYRKASPDIAGVHAVGDGVLFSVAVPDQTSEAQLVLYRKGEWEPCQIIELNEKDRIGQVSSILVDLDDPSGYEYNYRFDRVSSPDPAARRVRRAKNPKGKETEFRCSFELELEAKTEPLQIPYEESLLYKVHVKGYTASRSGVRHPGTFLGLSEKIPYFKELGINGLVLMPVYEFQTGSVTERSYTLDSGLSIKTPEVRTRNNYWGYSKGLYFAPKSDYCAGENGAQEFADLVDALHSAGIECILEFYFDSYADSRFVTDVLRYWRITYHVDGFRLVGDGNWIHGVMTDAVLCHTKLMCVGFDTDSLYKGQKPTVRNIGFMNLAYEHLMRRFLKGDLDVSAEDVAWHMRKNPANHGEVSYFADQDGFTMYDMVTYEEKHNDENGEENRDGTNENFSWNCGEEGKTRKATVNELRQKLLRNAFLLLMVSQTTPMIYGGDEFENSQNGNNNAWCQDNATGWITYNKNHYAAELREFVKACIAFRKAHPILHTKNEMRLADYKGYGFPDLSYHSQVAWMNAGGRTKAGIGMMYNGQYAKREDGSQDDILYIACNMYWQAQEFALPKLPAGLTWTIAVDTSRVNSFAPDQEAEKKEAGKNSGKGAQPAGGLLTDKSAICDPRSILILVAKKETEV